MWSNPVETQNNSQIIKKDGKNFVLVELPDQGNSYNDDVMYSPFNTKQLRQEFLRKVYSIMSVNIFILKFFPLIFFTRHLF